jgi:hypothetical protein
LTPDMSNIKECFDAYAVWVLQAELVVARTELIRAADDTVQLLEAGN